MSVSKSTGRVTPLGGTDGTQIGNTGDRMKVEAEFSPTATLPTITEEHNQIHTGNSYYLNGRTSLGNGGAKFWVFKTTTKKMHLLIELFAEKETDILLVEDLDILTQGTLETVLNRDRNSSNTSDASFYEGSYTIGVGGTNLNLVDSFITGGAVGQGNNPSMEDRDNNELILKPNTWYKIEFVSRANSNKMAWVIDWYEV